MARYRKKPIIIEAEQWFPDIVIEGVEYPPLPGTPQGEEYLRVYGPCGLIHTLEGKMVVMPSDWVITGVRGERYPCKPDIFKETYEKVEEVSGA